MPESSIVKKFSDVCVDNIEQCGGKGAHLGELTKAGFNVPPGFCIISQAYFSFLDYNNIDAPIREIVSSMDFDDLGDLDIKTKEIREMFKGGQMPPDFYEQISRSYFELADEGEGDPYVAIRSSNAIKGTNVSSFPGMMDTYHYIRGIDEVIYYVKKCWASVWTTRAAVARYQKGLRHSMALIAPVVQKMVNPEVAGVAFTANPINSSREEIVIESNWGLGESVVSGKAMTDFFLLDKENLNVKKKNITKKNMMIVMDELNGGRKECDVEPEKRQKATLSDEQLAELGKMAKSIEDYYHFPQDIEWAFVKNSLYILQARKIQGIVA